MWIRTSPGDAEVGQRLEVGRTLLHREHPDRAAGEPRRPPSRPVSTRSSARTDPPTHRYRAAGRQRAPVGEHRPVRDQVQDQVVRRVRAGEVVPAVVDHLVRADRPHEVQLGGVVDPGHVGAEPLGELDRERSRAAAGAVDQHPAARDGPLRALQGDRARLRDGRRLGERELRRLGGERGLRRDARTPRSRPSARGCRRTPRRRAGTGSPLPRPRRPRRRCPTRASGGPGVAARRSARTPATRAGTPSR